MEKERVIRITDIQTNHNGDDTIEVTTRGYLRGDADDYSLHYEEHFGDGLVSKTEIRVRDKKSASIIRGGDIISEIMLEAGKRHSCSYQTPYGDMMIGIFTRDVSSTIDRRGGELRLNYTVDFNGSLGAHKEMLICVSDELSDIPKPEA
ncbi:MAG: DUF1934 domain-containing protein [Clostridia bacterium]|nr:DUF1934 domain-containing protein [Clostridia bacterium]